MLCPLYNTNCVVLGRSLVVLSIEGSVVLLVPPVPPVPLVPLVPLPLVLEVLAVDVVPLLRVSLSVGLVKLVVPFASLGASVLATGVPVFLESAYTL